MNKGKQFEQYFRENWKRCFPSTFCFRLNDSLGGFSNVNTPCDFLCFPGKKLFMVECKSHDGSSISFSAIPQYERLLEYKDYENVIPGIIMWFKEKDKIIWADINTAEKIFTDGNKSIQLKMLGDERYNLKEVPSTKKRVYLEADYTYIVDLYSGR